MILSGDCLSEIDKIDSSSIQTVVTSPPYWGLRNYDNMTNLDKSHHQKNLSSI